MTIIEISTEIKTQFVTLFSHSPSCISSHSNSGAHPICLMRNWCCHCLREVHVIVYVKNHGYNNENCSSNEDTFPQGFTWEVMSINHSTVFGVVGILGCTCYQASFCYQKSDPGKALNVHMKLKDSMWVVGTKKLNMNKDIKTTYCRVKKYF